MKKITKLTPAQENIMRRLNQGYTPMCLSNTTLKGYDYVWGKQIEGSDLYRLEDTFHAGEYRTLNKMMFMGIVDRNIILDQSSLDFTDEDTVEFAASHRIKLQTVEEVREFETRLITIR